MATKAANSNLNRAAKVKNDEFYTQLADIEKELKHYKDQFRGKVVYCNCDDPFESNFFKYFAANFNALGLKRLITTSYVKSPIAEKQIPLFEMEGLKPDGKEPYVVEISEVYDTNNDGAISLEDVEVILRRNKKSSRRLLSDDNYVGGDFRSKECIELLKQADIVCTNPPFSLFRDYVAQLVEHKKRFLIIGNDNAIAYKDFFVFVKQDKVWAGYSKVREFRQPDGSTKKFGNVGWYTNLDTTKRHEKLTLYKKFSPKEYPTYINYDAIEVSKVTDIPMDYDGEMGVPITFFDKFNPNQFEIIGSSLFLGKPMKDIAPKGSFVQGGPRFYLPNGNGTYRRLFDRLVIRKKI